MIVNQKTIVWGKGVKILLSNAKQCISWFNHPGYLCVIQNVIIVIVFCFYYFRLFQLLTIAVYQKLSKTSIWMSQVMTYWSTMQCKTNPKKRTLQKKRCENKRILIINSTNQNEISLKNSFLYCNHTKLTFTFIKTCFQSFILWITSAT